MYIQYSFIYCIVQTCRPCSAVWRLFCGAVLASMTHAYCLDSCVLPPWSSVCFFVWQAAQQATKPRRQQQHQHKHNPRKETAQNSEKFLQIG